MPQLYLSCTQIIAEKMITRGSIVNISSTGSSGAEGHNFPNNISKAGLDIVTKQFALELDGHDIRGISVCPTMILSDSPKEVVASASNAAVHKILSTAPMLLLPGNDEAVCPVVYLLSDMSTMITGTIQVNDGRKLSNSST